MARMNLDFASADWDECSDGPLDGPLDGMLLDCCCPTVHAVVALLARLLRDIRRVVLKAGVLALRDRAGCAVEADASWFLAVCTVWLLAASTFVISLATRVDPMVVSPLRAPPPPNCSLLYCESECVLDWVYSSSKKIMFLKMTRDVSIYRSFFFFFCSSRRRRRGGGDCFFTSGLFLEETDAF